jgi:hypothetical protein
LCDVVGETHCAFVIEQSDGSVEIFFLALIGLGIMGVLVNIDSEITVGH